MYPDTVYSVSAKYCDPNGRHDLKHCYLRLKHLTKPLTMMWYQADGSYSPWAGEEGENCLTIMDVEAAEIADGTQGYELTWKFKINDSWPEVENAIDFGVFASDDTDLTSGWDYDDTKASFILQNIIQQYMAKDNLVTIDGNKYHIILLKGCVDPSTLTPTDSLLIGHEPSVWKVYTDANFEPLSESDKGIATKIGAIDRANSLVQHAAGTSNGISSSIAAIKEMVEADEELAKAEFVEAAAKIAAFETADLVNPLVIDKATTALSTAVYGLVEHYTDPTRYELEVGRAFLEGAINNYTMAEKIAEEHNAGIDDYKTAKDYLEYYYKAYFEEIYGRGLLFSDERIGENPFLTVAMWVRNYITHVGTQLVSHISIWHRIGMTTIKGAAILKNGVDTVEELPRYISTLNDITNDVSQLLKDETFAVDYTLSLAARSTMPLWKWGIIGVDTINSNLCSPGELRVFDSLNRVTGLINGEIEEEIPNSGYDSGANSVIIFNPTDSYRYEVVGTEEGTYGLEVNSVEAGEVTNFAATDIPTAGNATHRYTIDWEALSQGEEAVTVQIDSDGDGDFEETVVTSQPNTPSSPSPLNHATNVSTETDLTWSGGDPDAGDIVTYDVYFGTSSTPPLKGTIGPYTADQTSISYDPGALSRDTKYYWKIVARDNHSITKEGPVSGFTTISPPSGEALASIKDNLVIAYGYKFGEGVGGWTVYNPEWAVAHPGRNSLTTLYMQRGYWINVSEGCDLTYGANIYHLDEGWNLIGWCGAAVVGPPSDEDNHDVAVGLTTLGDELIIAYGYKFGEGVQGWTVYNPEWATTHPERNSLTTLYMGRGYWVNVSEVCDLTYEAKTYQLDEGWNLIGWLGW